MHWLFFVLGAVLSWGAYGPVLHRGQAAFGPHRALLCVGFAYFLVGVLVPFLTLWWQDQLHGFNARGAAFSTAAGVLGALGAVCIIWSFQTGGKPLYVMPLVFAGAPMVNAIVTMALHPPQWRTIHPLLVVGFFCAAAGAWLILRYVPR